MKPLHISRGRAKIPLKSFNRNPVRFVPFFNEMNFNFVYNWNLLFLSARGEMMRGQGGSGGGGDGAASGGRGGDGRSPKKKMMRPAAARTNR